MQRTISPDLGRRRLVRAVAVNAGAAAAGVAAWLAWRRAFPPPTTRFEGSITRGFYERVDDVGHMPRPGQRVTARRITHGATVYDVAYTIDGDGFRVLPAAPSRPAASLLLFGDSNTFGEGVNDDQAYAWRLAERGRGRLEVRNFAIPGWGPHQMLAGLQSGRFVRPLRRPPSHAVFLFIDDHLRRVAGEASWDRHGPRYRLAADGRPVRDGNFDSDGSPAGTPWRPDEPAALAAALLVEARRELRKLAPDLALHVLYWNEDEEAPRGLVATRLAAAGVVVHMVDRFLPGYRDDWRGYVLSEVDGHPSPMAHRRIADYIATVIVPA